MTPLEVPPKRVFNRFWIMSEIEVLFNNDGTFKEFKVIRSFKQMAKEDKIPKEKQEVQQRKMVIEDDEII